MENPFKRSTVEPILVGAATLIIIQFLIFPGLTINNTIINLLSSFGVLVLGILVYWYLVKYNSKNEKEVIEPGETELDYIPKKEVVKKKKAIKPRKGEFPMEPHHPPKEKNSSKSKTKNKK